MMTKRTLTKRVFALLLTAVMCFVQMPILSVSAAQSVKVQDFKELEKAISSYADAQDDVEIVLGKDITITKALKVGTNSNGKKLTIKSDGDKTYKIIRGEGVTGDLFITSADTKVTYDNVTVDAKETKKADEKPAAEVTKEPEPTKEPEATKEAEPTKEPEAAKEPEATQEKESEVMPEQAAVNEPEAAPEQAAANDPAIAKEAEAANNPVETSDEQTDSEVYPLGMPPNFEVTDFQWSAATVSYDGSPKPLNVEAAPAVASYVDSITVKYDGIDQAPTAVGTYAITIDVKEKGGIYTDKILSLGNYTIERATLTATNYTLSNNQVVYDGTKKSVTVTGPTDVAGGITIKYNGDTNVPSAPGTYAITVVVAGNANYNNVTIALGNLVIDKMTLAAKDFVLQNNNVTYDGEAHAVSVNAAAGVTGIGKVTVKYNGKTMIWRSAGSYEVTIDVAEGTLYKPVQDLKLGKLVIKPAKLKGTPEITGAAKYGQTLTTDITDLNAQSKLSYQWYRGDKAISGATSRDYEVVAKDIGSKLRVIVTASGNYEGSVKSEKTAEVKKADGGSVKTAPTAYTITTTQIQVNTVANQSDSGQTVEYGISRASDKQPTTWQDSKVFSKLSASTNYYVWARTKENTTYYAGPAKVSTVMKTKAVTSTTRTTTSTRKAGSTIPKTGDENDMMIWLAAVLLSGVLGTGLVVRKRRMNLDRRR